MTGTTPVSDNSDAARYQRGLQSYASQFHIRPGRRCHKSMV